MNQLSAMRIYRRVVELGSFAAVAREGDLSNAVISKYVGQLEAQLGSRLIQRTTRQMSLTEAGQRYYEVCVHVLDELEAAENQIRDAAIRPKGKLRLNAPMSFGLLHVAPALADFSAQYPEIDIELSLGDQLQDMVEEGFDLALRIRYQLADSSLIAKPLAPITRVLCAAPAYLQRAGVPQTPADLSQHNCLRYSLATDSQRWRFQRDAEISEVPIRGTLNANNSLALQASLLAGRGIALMPHFLVGAAVSRRELIVLLPDYQLEPRNLFVVYPSRRGLTQKVQLLTDFFSARFALMAKNQWVTNVK